MPPPLSRRARASRVVGGPGSARSAPQQRRAEARGHRGTLMVALGAAVGAIAALAVTLMGKTPLGEPTTQNVMAATTAPVEPPRSTAPAVTHVAPVANVSTAAADVKGTPAKPRPAQPSKVTSKKPENPAESVVQAPNTPAGSERSASTGLFDGID